jgi:AmiR/NasT family two-component response regulator
MTQKKRTHLYLSEELWERLRQKAFDERVSMSSLAEEILEKGVPAKKPE